MRPESQMSIDALLSSDDPKLLRQGLEQVKQEIQRVGVEDARSLLEMITSIFYIDTLERPDLAPLLEDAITLLVGFGDWVIPYLLDGLDAGDIKVQMVTAYALGRMGADAIGPLMEEYGAARDHTLRAFILYAMGKIKSPKIQEALPLLLTAARSRDRELRDTATRSIGKFIESIGAEALSEEMRAELIDVLRANLADSDSGIRAKAVRSLGKLLRFGHMNEQEQYELKHTLLHILGKDEAFDWDRAYLVRKEAEEALGFLS